MIESKLKKVNSIWFDEIPENWSFVKLKYMIEFLNGFAFKSDDFEDDGTSIVRIGDINSQIDVENCKKVDLKKYPNISSAKINKGDILIAMTGATIGKNAQYLQNEEIYANQRVGIIRSNTDFSQNYLRYVINTFELSEYIRLLCSGSAQENISGSQISDFIIPVPPLSEQQKISAFLDRKTAQIDTIIEKKQKLLQLLDEKKKSVINEAVTKGLNPNVPIKNVIEDWFQEIPAHWKNLKLKWVSEIYAGGTPSTSNEDYWENGTIPWLNSGEVNKGTITSSTNYISQLGFNNSSAKWIPKKSILIALAGQGKTRGTVAKLEIQATCNQSLGVIVPKVDELDYEFLYYWLDRNYLNIRSLSGLDRRDGLNLQMIGDFSIPLPPIEEQKAISIFLSLKEEKFRILCNKIETQIAKLQEYRQSLISEAVTGKINLN